MIVHSAQKTLSYSSVAFGALLSILWKDDDVSIPYLAILYDNSAAFVIYLGEG